MAPKEIHAILTETLACFPPGRAKDFSSPLYMCAVKPNIKKLLCKASVLRSGVRRSPYFIHKTALNVRNEIYHARPLKVLPHADTVRLKVKSCTGTLCCVVYVTLCLRRAS